MNPKTQKMLFVVLSLLLLTTALYCLLGVLQVASLFTGERAIGNVQFWGALTCVAICLSGLFGVLAARAAKLTRPSKSY